PAGRPKPAKGDACYLQDEVCNPGQQQVEFHDRLRVVERGIGVGRLQELAVSCMSLIDSISNYEVLSVIMHLLETAKWTNLLSNNTELVRSWIPQWKVVPGPHAVVFDYHHS
ncbi:hypothetical protein GB937_010391, partial [Aspergillus fischeri]